MNSLTNEIKNLLNKDYTEVAPRGLRVHEYLNEEMILDSTKPFSSFEQRPFNFKYFAGELLWYLCGDFKTEFIGNFSNFWNNLTDKNGEINSNYGNIMLNKQFVYAYKSLVNDKFSRQAIININGKEHQKPTKDFPCTLNILFYIRDNKLNMRILMRSQDIFYGLQYDVPWYAFVHQNMYLLLKEVYPELELGQYIHKMDNVHYYERHFDLVESIKKETHDKYHTLELLKPIITIEDNKAVVNNQIYDEYIKFKYEIPNWKFTEWKNYLNNLGFFNIKLKK